MDDVTENNRAWADVFREKDDGYKQGDCEDGGYWFHYDNDAHVYPDNRMNIRCKYHRQQRGALDDKGRMVCSKCLNLGQVIDKVWLDGDIAYYSFYDDVTKVLVIGNDNAMSVNCVIETKGEGYGTRPHVFWYELERSEKEARARDDWQEKAALQAKEAIAMIVESVTAV